MLVNTQRTLSGGEAGKGERGRNQGKDFREVLGGGAILDGAGYFPGNYLPDEVLRSGERIAGRGNHQRTAGVAPDGRIYTGGEVRGKDGAAVGTRGDTVDYEKGRVAPEEMQAEGRLDGQERGRLQNYRDRAEKMDLKAVYEQKGDTNLEVIEGESACYVRRDSRFTWG